MPPPVIYSSGTISNGRMTAAVPISAIAELRHNNMNGGTPPSQTIQPPGWWKGTCPAHHNRGHLIGNQLGGSGVDPRNLVTLVAGTNHPIMFEFEDMVYRYVRAHPLDEPFDYMVTCDYSQQSYDQTSGFPYPGAAGNPFCLFPAPAALLLTLRDRHKNYPLTGNIPPQMRITNFLMIPNGVYKAYSGGAHVTRNCWSVTHTAALLLQDAIDYAQHLGYP